MCKSLLVLLLLSAGTSALQQNTDMFVIFGSPGAGKSTVADAVCSAMGPAAAPLRLDLDVCVSQQMRENFAKGIYPTLEDREIFAGEALDHVEDVLAAETPKQCLVSFSFVNTDLRDIYRRRFPHARWILYDVSPRLAEERMAAREGHFYKPDEVGNRGEEWEFAPVTFEHDQLNGQDPVPVNVDKLAAILQGRRQHSS
ncbi:hypothetical protein TrST_g12658 [Triparma strigata]|uniref:Uncharacterized protein n=1 Tax=Triparma strigata TaxID=1606541 RepID=A0A9W7EZ40_9STRA|nr:hypothetical protein TrST_g12658 [Triparma strigata]